MDILEIKRKARSEAARRRGLAHEQLSDTAKAALAARGLPVALGPERRVVSGFFPYKSEISALPLLKRLAGEGWTIVMPVVIGAGQPLVFRAWSVGQPTVPGVWNIPVPAEDAAVHDPDVLLVPGLSFDRKGFRLGYGGGFYDRTLDLLNKLGQPVAIGVCYQAQLVEAVPRAPYDVPLHYVMTEQETIACG